jgi:hypothetical protein
LAGGLLRPIDPDDLKIAVRDSLASVQLGELEPIKDFPRMVRAAAGTLDKAWSAGIDLPAKRIRAWLRSTSSNKKSCDGCPRA